MTVPVRTPAVAGRFYPDKAEDLLRDVHKYTSPSSTELRPHTVSAIGCIAPHAGYMYSGSVAGAVYSHIEIPQTCIVLCPNHTGRGSPVATMADTRWQTPLGVVDADQDLAIQLMAGFPLLAEDSAAHRYEHAIEVQLPFLQAARRAGSSPGNALLIVPIVLGTGELEELLGLGEALADVVKGEQNQGLSKVLIIASSDMNHYESDKITRRKDQMAIDRVLALDACGLWEVVMRERISMCGFGPTVVMLTAAKLLGATSAELIRYATSGEVSGDFESVVGYAGIVLT